MSEFHLTRENRDVLINTSCILPTVLRTMNDKLRNISHEKGKTPRQPQKRFPGVNINAGAANQWATIQHVMICKIHVVGQDTKSLHTRLRPLTCVKSIWGLEAPK